MFSLISKFVLFAVFPIAIVFGGWVLTDYSYRPGQQGEVVSDLSGMTSIELLTTFDCFKGSRPTIVIAYHPHCPCTAATICNLEQLINAASVRPQIVAFGYCPATETEAWIDSPNTKQLQHLGATAIADQNCDFCRQLGTITSGHILLFDVHQQLCFSGGITPGRGHEGNCPAYSELLNRLNGHSDGAISWPVFGCPLVDLERPQ